jgi:hypothetical protein
MKRFFATILIAILVMSLSAPMDSFAGTSRPMPFAVVDNSEIIEEEPRGEIFVFWFIFTEKDNQQITISSTGKIPTGGDAWMGTPQNGFYTNITIRITDTTKPTTPENLLSYSTNFYEKGDMTLEKFRINILLPLVEIYGMPRIDAQPVLPSIPDRLNEEDWRW